MSVQERMRLCRIIDKMEKNTEFVKRLGIVNQSTIKGKTIDDYKKEKR